MFQTASYFFGFVGLAIVLMLWEWRHAIAWSRGGSSVQTVKNGIARFKLLLFGVMTILRKLLHHVFFKKTDTVSVTNHKSGWKLLFPFGLLFLVLFTLLWLPLSASFPAMSYVFSALVVMMLVSLVMVGRECLNHDTDSQSQPLKPTQQKLVLWLVCSGCFLLTASLLNMGVSLNTLDLREMVMEARSVPVWQRMLSFVSFVLVSFILLHRHKVAIGSAQNALLQWQTQKAEISQNTSAHTQSDDGVAEVNELTDDEVSAKTHADKQNATSDDAHIYEKEQPFLESMNNVQFATMLVDYLLLVVVSVLVVLVYLGGWFPWFGYGSADTTFLPETWFVFKLLLVLVMFLMLRQFVSPFFDTQHTVSKADNEEVVVVNTQRAFYGLVYVATPMVLISFFISFVRLWAGQ